MNFGDSLGKNKIIIAICLVLMVIIAIIGFTLSRSGFDSDDELEAILQTDKTIARVEETINLSAEKCNGKIKSFSWDFGDGNTSSEKNPRHKYERAGWYNVTLIINNDKGKESNTTEKIGIQYSDVFLENDISREYSTLRDPWGYGFSVSTDIGYNINKPSAVIHAEIYNAIGSFRFSVDVMFFDDYDKRIASGEVLYSESKRSISPYLEFDYIVQPSEIPDETFNKISELHADIVVDDGTWESAIITMEVTFPMDNISQD